MDEDDTAELLNIKIKMLKTRLAKSKERYYKTNKERRKERAVEANIEHFTNELKQILKTSPHINRISNHIKMSETNDYKIFNKDSPVRKSPSKSPRSKKATKSILKKGGRSKRNITRKNNKHK